MSRLPEFDYSLNPYKGCIHGCAYCYAPNIMRIPRSEWGETVGVKWNMAKVLSKELRNKKRGVVGISLTTDPYQPAEKRYNITRLCLEQLARHDFPVSILTKSPLITRDLDILGNFKEIEVGLTLTTEKDSERKILEPNAPSIDSRILALKKISDNGITTYAFLGPLYPTISLNELKELVGKIKDAGVPRVSADRLNLKPGVWSSVCSTLKEYPKQLEVWEEFVKGNNNKYDKIFHSLERLCKKEGIEYEFQAY
jgi:DNA repair photolyase